MSCERSDKCKCSKPSSQCRRKGKCDPNPIEQIGQTLQEINGSLQQLVSCPPSRKFSFSVIGDTAYDAKGERELRSLISNVINKEDNRFVVHVGDLQNDPRGLGTDPVSNIATTVSAWLPKRDILFAMNKPLIVSPGDNDWSDTWVAPVSNPDPIGSLNAFRSVFYGSTNVPFPFAVVKQPDEFPEYKDYVENRRWIVENVVFATFHTIAGRDNNGNSSFNHPAVQAESLIRINAAVAWINRTFDVAASIGAKGVAFFSQAVIEWITTPVGFVEIATAMKGKIAQYPQMKVLYFQGDNHQFNVQKPLRGALHSGSTYAQYENFTSIEVPGAPRTAIGTINMTSVAGGSGRVRVTVDPDSEEIFFLSLDTKTQTSLN